MMSYECQPIMIIFQFPIQFLCQKIREFQKHSSICALRNPDPASSTTTSWHSMTLRWQKGLAEGRHHSVSCSSMVHSSSIPKSPLRYGDAIEIDTAFHTALKLSKLEDSWQETATSFHLDIWWPAQFWPSRFHNNHTGLTMSAWMATVLPDLTF